MPSRQRTSSFSSRFGTPSGRARWYGTLGVLIFIFIILSLARWAPHPLATPAQALAHPLIAVRNGIGSGFDDTLSLFQSKTSLQTENNNLQQEVIFYKTAIAERDYFLNQTTQLQALLGDIGSSTSAKFIVAQIISKPNFSPYDTLIIAEGSGSNIAAGDLVYADPHTLIGYISSVSADAATVTAYSTPGQNVNVLIGSSSIEAAASGLGGGTLEVLLPHNSPVNIGDVVIAADVSGGNILGQVEVATSTPTDPFERVLFTSPIDIFDLSNVLIKMPTPPTLHGTSKK